MQAELQIGSGLRTQYVGLLEIEGNKAERLRLIEENVRDYAISVVDREEAKRGRTWVLSAYLAMRSATVPANGYGLKRMRGARNDWEVSERCRVRLAAPGWFSTAIE